MKGCSRNVFDLSPATDQTLFTIPPITHGPCIVNATPEAPSPQVDCDPTRGDVAVGNDTTGPIPQMNSVPAPAGERKAVNVMSPRPVVPPTPASGLGWVMMGMIVRVMTFSSPK